MNKHKAIPQGYMTVGEVAKKMNTTVRTLQHYDREGLLSPSSVSEGGRRLYIIPHGHFFTRCYLQMQGFFR